MAKTPPAKPRRRPEDSNQGPQASLGTDLVLRRRASTSFATFLVIRIGLFNTRQTRLVQSIHLQTCHEASPSPTL